MTAVLNSKLCNQELFKLFPKTGTGNLIISIQGINPLRVPIPNKEQEDDIVKILDIIIELKKQNPSTDTTHLEPPNRPTCICVVRFNGGGGGSGGGWGEVNNKKYKPLTLEN